MGTKKKLLTVLGVITAILVVVSVFVWLADLGRRSAQFKEPKIVGADLEGEPVDRLPPGWKLRPIRIMAKTKALLKCYVVASPLGRKYWVDIEGKIYKSKDCVFHFPVIWAPGFTAKAVIHYSFKTTKGWKEDTLEVPFTVIPHGQFIRIHTLEDAYHKPIKGPFCPTQKAFVYGEAALPISNTKDLSALFFVEDPLRPGPTVQVRITHQEHLEPIRFKIQQYRRYGDKLFGIAFWSEDPVLIGPKKPDRSVYNIYAGLFPSSVVEEVIKRSLKVLKVSQGKVMVRSTLRSINQIKGYAAFGAVTEAWRVIRSSPARSVLK